MTTEEKTLAERVDDLMRYALYNEDEVDGDGAPDDAIVVSGVTARFAMHPGRVDEISDDVGDLVETIPESSFFKSEGGGMSFLRLAVTNEGRRWGEHMHMQEFVVLAIACGYAEVLPIPPEECPGGVPYYVFTHEPKTDE